jgi:hypothetical protein
VKVQIASGATKLTIRFYGMPAEESSIGHKGMVHAARDMATTAIDLFNDPTAITLSRQCAQLESDGIWPVGTIAQ